MEVGRDQRTILKAAFVAIAFVVTGKFVVSAFAMLLLVFMTDFAKIAVGTRISPLSLRVWSVPACRTAEGSSSQARRIPIRLS